jgi:hypothetical protein
MAFLLECSPARSAAALALHKPASAMCALPLKAAGAVAKRYVH